jgi:hypothetical protein
MLRRVALWLECFLAVSALGGGAALIAGPRGEIIPIPVRLLRGSWFDTYLIPGFVLFAVLGIGSIIAGTLTWHRSSLAPPAAIALGFALLIWMGVEISVVGYSNRPPLQDFYIILGVGILGLGLLRTFAANSGSSRKSNSKMPPN